MEADREKLNFSTWDRDGNEAGDAAETIVEGTTPPGRYLLLHSEARLSQDEQLRLVQGLEAMEEGRHDRRGRGCGRG